MNLTQAEQETHLSMSADDRGTWHVYSDDPVMQRRLEATGAVLVKAMDDGVGKEYTLRAEQLTFRKGKRRLSDDQRAQLAMRLRLMRENTRTVQATEASKALQEVAP